MFFEGECRQSLINLPLYSAVLSDGGVWSGLRSKSEAYRRRGLERFPAGLWSDGSFRSPLQSGNRGDCRASLSDVFDIEYRTCPDREVAGEKR